MQGRPDATIPAGTFSEDEDGNLLFAPEDFARIVGIEVPYDMRLHDPSTGNIIRFERPEDL